MASSSFVNICLSVEDILAPVPDPYCDLCSKTFKHYPAFNWHRVKFHKTISTPSDERISNGQSLVRRLDTEISTTAASRYFCPVNGCKYEYSKSSGGVDDSCKVGRKKRGKRGSSYFPDRRSLKQHYFKAHSKKSFLCAVCRLRKFSLERDKRYHEKHCRRTTTSVVANGDGSDSPTVTLPVAAASPNTVFIVIEKPVYIYVTMVAAPAFSYTDKKSDIPIIPKPNSAWQCFVDKADASVQTNPVEKPVAKKRRLATTNEKKKTKHRSVQVDCDKATFAAPSYNNASSAGGFGAGVFGRGFSSVLSDDSSCSLHLYDETACQTAVVQTLTAGVQSVVAQSDIFCQTNIPPLMADAAVTADIIRSIDNPNNNAAALSLHNVAGASSFMLANNFDENFTWSNIETQTDDLRFASATSGNWTDDVIMDDFDVDAWRHIETQTSLIDFIDSFQSAGTQTYTDIV